jgi:hypothetical protein
MVLCSYGCGKEGKYQLKNGKWCCEENFNKCFKVKERKSFGQKIAYQNGIMNAKKAYANRSQ